MKLRREWVEELIFGKTEGRRFTQDSPVLPDVWIEFALQDAEAGYSTPIDLLFTPHRTTTPAALAVALRKRLAAERRSAAWRSRHEDSDHPAEIAYNQAAAVAQLHFDELVRVVLPMSKWWYDNVRYTPSADLPNDFAKADVQEELAESLEAEQKGQTQPGRRPPLSPDLVWMIRVVGTILLARDAPQPPTDAAAKLLFDDIKESKLALVESFADLMRPLEESEQPGPDRDRPANADRDAKRKASSAKVWLVSRNREASTAVWRSTLSVKSDAAQRVFKLDCSNINWAILDSGIDARHPAFWKRATREELRLVNDPAGKRKMRSDEARLAWPKETRVKGTYDFTRIRQLLNTDGAEIKSRIARLESDLAASPGSAQARRWERELKFWNGFLAEDNAPIQRRAKQLRRSLRTGQAIDWDTIRPFIEIPHTPGEYEAPRHEHGTHVAGILGADWRTFDWEPGDQQHPGEHDLVGVCPDIGLYDFRVLDDEGKGNEFTIMAALQFIRHLNAHREQPLINGVNMSLAIPHDKANYACGRTPVCDECERAIGTGVVIVAAAGNKGYIYYATPTGGAAEGYAAISIQDPGNADGVITVGATHRYQPHTYGVSYFSSRGPTGDGRQKPDLVAPGEKILSAIPNNGSKSKDGTSMAAPHVSGAAALLLARHRELMGQPRRIKEILCRSATDLGRERHFQGSGMVDILRAIQSV
jgi:serine protease AprX